MFKSIQKFMQKEDSNGSWSDCTDKKYMYETLESWLDDDLECNKRIQGYLDYLSEWV